MLLRYFFSIGIALTIISCGDSTEQTTSRQKPKITTIRIGADCCERCEKNHPVRAQADAMQRAMCEARCRSALGRGAGC